MGRILACIDGSTYAQSVCDHAAWAAGRTAASIDLLHVLGRRDTASASVDLSGSLDADARETLLADLAALDQQKAKLAQQRGRLILDGAQARLKEATLSEVTAKLRHGDVVEAVEELEADASLIVMGKRGEAADFATLHLGSNLERVARATKRPLLVASRAFRPIGRFLIAFDGGQSIAKAIQHMVVDRLLRGLECRLLMVGSVTPERRKRLLDAATTLRNAGYPIEARIEPGQPDEVIAREVEVSQFDLLVMGAYGHSRIRSLIIGSTTTQMIRSCRVPVLLFR
jgi:nucleotide-binding universal stress UspA family protein